MVSSQLDDFVKQKGLSTFDDAEPAASSRQAQKHDPSLLQQFTKQKGLASFGDEEQEEELLLPQGHHELVVHVEHCTARRPSRTGSLRGSSEKYEEQAAQLREVLQPLSGEGSLRLEVNRPEHTGGAAPSRPQPRSRPASAGSGSSRSAVGPAPLQPVWPENRNGSQGWPRIGAFEVSFVLRNCQSQINQPSCAVYSKLQTGRWPAHGKLKAHMASLLHEQLKQDERDFAGYEMRQAVARQGGATNPT